MAFFFDGEDIYDTGDIIQEAIVIFLDDIGDKPSCAPGIGLLLRKCQGAKFGEFMRILMEIVQHALFELSGEDFLEGRFILIGHKN